MEVENKVFNKLDEIGISYNYIEHPPAFTTEEADKFIEGYEGVRTKTLFLRNRKKKKFYLIIMDDKKRVNIKELENLLEDKGLGFCSDDLLDKKMKLKPGYVSIFGLMNNDEKDINVIFDEDVINEETFTFHPNINTITLFIKKDDMIKFVESEGYDYKILKIPE